MAGRTMCKKIMEGINDKSIDYILSYQSRVGPLKWIGPSTEDVIVENSKKENICYSAYSLCFQNILKH